MMVPEKSSVALAIEAACDFDLFGACCGSMVVVTLSDDVVPGPLMTGIGFVLTLPVLKLPFVSPESCSWNSRLLTSLKLSLTSLPYQF